MGREYFVTKLMAGSVQGSPKMNWWLQHSACTAHYLQQYPALRVEDRKTARILAERHGASWSQLIGLRGNPIMEEHTKLELAMIESTFANPFDKAEMFAIADFMSENVLQQTRFLGAVNPEFPANRWKELLLEHVKLFVASVRFFATPDDRKYASCVERCQENTLALAAFSTEWL